MFRKTTWVIAGLVALVAVTHIAWPAPKKKKPAVVKLSSSDMTLYLTFTKGMKLKVTSKGTPLKAGNYFVKEFRLTKKDKKGKTWSILCKKRFGSLQNVMVAAGQEKVLNPGPPLKMRYWARQGDGANSNTVTISMSVLGHCSEAYHPGAYKGKKSPPVPVIRIRTESGKTLQTAKMTLGNAARYVWKVPKGFKGKYKIDYRVVFGPFECIDDRENYIWEIK